MDSCAWADSDLKPSNIGLCEKGSLKVFDLGLSVIQEVKEGRDDKYEVRTPNGSSSSYVLGGVLLFFVSNALREFHPRFRYSLYGAPELDAIAVQNHRSCCVLSIRGSSTHTWQTEVFRFFLCSPGVRYPTFSAVLYRS